MITSSFHLPAVQFQKQHTTERSLLFEKLKKKILKKFFSTCSTQWLLDHSKCIKLNASSECSSSPLAAHSKNFFFSFGPKVLVWFCSTKLVQQQNGLNFPYWIVWYNQKYYEDSSLRSTKFCTVLHPWIAWFFCIDYVRCLLPLN